MRSIEELKCTGLGYKRRFGNGPIKFKPIGDLSLDDPYSADEVNWESEHEYRRGYADGVYAALESIAMSPSAWDAIYEQVFIAIKRWSEETEFSGDVFYMAPPPIDWSDCDYQLLATRHKYKHKQWAEHVKERAHYRCQKCGSKDRVEAHHVRLWADYPELRHKVSNGQALCYACHKRAHAKRRGDQ